MIFNFGLLFSTSGPAAGQLTQLGNKLQGIGQAATAAGSMLTKAFTLPFIAGVGLSTAIGGKFENEMQKVNRRISETPETLKKLGDSALGIGKMSGKGAMEMASALNGLAFEGYNALDMLQLLPSATRYAQAENLNMATAIEHTADMLEMFGMNTNESVKALDILTYTASHTGQTTEELFAGFKALKMQAEDLNWSLESVASAMLVLGKSGFKGEEGGKVFFKIIDKLNDPANSVIKILKGMGVRKKDLYDANGALRELGVILDVLKTKNFTPMQFNKMFGKDAIAAKALIGAGSEGLKTSGVEKSAGIVDKTAKDMDKGFIAATNRMKASIEALGIAIANSGILDAATKSVIKFTELIEKVSSMSPELKKRFLIFGGITASVGPLLLLIGGVITAFLAISTAIAAVGAPAIAIISAIVVAVVALGVIVVKNWKIISEKMAEPVEKIKKVWNRLLPFFKLLWLGISEVFKLLIPVFQKIWDAVKPIIDALFTALNKVLTAFETIAKFVLPKDLRDKLGFTAAEGKPYEISVMSGNQKVETTTNINLSMPPGFKAYTIDPNTYIRGAQ